MPTILKFAADAGHGYQNPVAPMGVLTDMPLMFNGIIQLAIWFREGTIWIALLGGILFLNVSMNSSWPSAPGSANGIASRALGITVARGGIIRCARLLTVPLLEPDLRSLGTAVPITTPETVVQSAHGAAETPGRSVTST